MLPFEPLFRNAHAQTIVGHYWRRPGNDPRFPVESRLYRTEPNVQVLVESQRPAQPAAGEIVMVHGLESSGDAGYIRSLSAIAIEAGYATHRFHMRTCGGTEHLCSTLYHAGLTSDLLSVLRQIREERTAPIYLIGFSLGGNVVLKLTGELGETAASLLHAVCAVSTPIDLYACSASISLPRNRLYARRFVRRMKDRLAATRRFDEREFAPLQSLWEIDDRITAPSFGFGDAANYYRTQSAIRYLDGVRVPVLLIQAKDDTFIPFETFALPAVRSNPWIELLATEHGGHLGFIARGPQRFWVDRAIMDWISKQNGKTI